MVLPKLKMCMSSPEQLNTLFPLPSVCLWLPHSLSAYSPSVAPSALRTGSRAPALAFKALATPSGALASPSCRPDSIPVRFPQAMLTYGPSSSAQSLRALPQMTPDPRSSRRKCSLLRASAAWLLSVGFITRLPKSPLGWLKTA